MGAVDYAERDLGVHAIHADSEQPLADLDAALNVYREQAARIRRAHDGIDRREHELASDLRASDGNVSQEAIKRHLKEQHQTDDFLCQMRDVLRDAQSKQEEAHAVIELSKYRLRVISARMNELGGLLAFYAAAKKTK